MPKMKLNYEVWRAAMDAAESAYEKTVLLSVKAYISGKLHRSRARIDWFTAKNWGKLEPRRALELASSGGSDIFDLNETDQEKFIKDSLMPTKKIYPDGRISIHWEKSEDWYKKFIKAEPTVSL